MAEKQKKALGRVLLSRDPGLTTVHKWTREIGHRMLTESQYMLEANSRFIHTDDLSSLFTSYDECFLDGLCRRILGPDGIRFDLSKRMTRAAGKTIRYPDADGPPTLRLKWPHTCFPMDFRKATRKSLSAACHARTDWKHFSACLNTS